MSLAFLYARVTHLFIIVVVAPGHLECLSLRTRKRYLESDERKKSARCKPSASDVDVERCLEPAPEAKDVRRSQRKSWLLNLFRPLCSFPTTDGSRSRVASGPWRGRAPASRAYAPKRNVTRETNTNSTAVSSPRRDTHIMSSSSEPFKIITSRTGLYAIHLGTCTSSLNAPTAMLRKIHWVHQCPGSYTWRSLVLSRFYGSF